MPKHEKITSFEYDGKTYELNMTRAGVRAAEAQGLLASEIADKGQSSAALLFFASLYSGYKVNPNKATAMLDDLLDDGTFDFDTLLTDLSEAYVQLFGSGESETKTTPARKAKVEQ